MFLLCLQALELLPSSTEVREVYTFLSSVLEDKEKKRKNCQVLKSLLFAEHLQVNMLALCGLPGETRALDCAARGLGFDSRGRTNTQGLTTLEMKVLPLFFKQLDLRVARITP